MASKSQKPLIASAKIRFFAESAFFGCMPASVSSFLFIVLCVNEAELSLVPQS